MLRDMLPHSRYGIDPSVYVVNVRLNHVSCMSFKTFMLLVPARTPAKESAVGMALWAIEVDPSSLSADEKATTKASLYPKQDSSQKRRDSNSLAKAIELPEKGHVALWTIKACISDSHWLARS